MTDYLFKLTEYRKVNDLKKVERKEIPNNSVIPKLKCPVSAK